MKTLHPQVTISHGAMEAEVDEKLAPLILELWRAGWDTSMSCWNHQSAKLVWVQFDWQVHLEEFLNAVAADVSTPGSMRDRAGMWYFGEFARTSKPLSPDDPGSPNKAKGAWEYHVTVMDYGDETPDFRMAVSVLFPRRDLKTVLARMQEWNERDS